MSYIGNSQQNQSYTPAVDFFSGDGSTTAFTLSRPVASVAQVQAVINNVPQTPTTAYSVSGQTITFTSAPGTGTNNIYIYYTSPNLSINQPGQATVGPIQLDVTGAQGTGAMSIPAGTIAQRPTGVQKGYTRFNTELEITETWDGLTWVSGGSSAGGFLYENTQTLTDDYTITAGKNALSAGPVTVATGVTITVPSGSTWTIV